MEKILKINKNKKGKIMLFVLKLKMQEILLLLLTEINTKNILKNMGSHMHTRKLIKAKFLFCEIFPKWVSMIYHIRWLLMTWGLLSVLEVILFLKSCKTPIKNTRRNFVRKCKVLQMTKYPERLGMEVIMWPI